MNTTSLTLRVGKPTRDKSKKGTVFEEIRTFNDTLADSYLFIPTKQFYQHAQSVVKRWQTIKSQMLQDIFRRRTQPLLKNIWMQIREKEADKELIQKVELSQNNFKKWMKSSNSTADVSSLAAQETVRHRKTFTDGEYIKESFIKFSEHLFMDFKSKSCSSCVKTKVTTSSPDVPTLFAVLRQQESL